MKNVEFCYVKLITSFWNWRWFLRIIVTMTYGKERSTSLMRKLSVLDKTLIYFQSNGSYDTQMYDNIWYPTPQENEEWKPFSWSRPDDLRMKLG